MYVYIYIVTYIFIYTHTLTPHTCGYTSAVISLEPSILAHLANRGMQPKTANPLTNTRAASREGLVRLRRPYKSSNFPWHRGFFLWLRDHEIWVIPQTGTTSTGRGTERTPNPSATFE